MFKKSLCKSVKILATVGLVALGVGLGSGVVKNPIFNNTAVVYAAEAKEGVVVETDGSINFYKDNQIVTDFTGMGTDASTGKRYWFDAGVAARDKEAYDPDSNAWYWFDQDGAMAVNKDVFIKYENPVSTNEEDLGKWVRYDENGGMIKGENYKDGAWYYFDPVTGKMAKGFKIIPNGTAYGKWVYYDLVTGQMQHGEVGVGGYWYYFDENTGEQAFGFKYLPDADKTVYYDEENGAMAHGYTMVHSKVYYFDNITGKMAQGKCVVYGIEHEFDPETGELLDSWNKI